MQKTKAGLLSNMNSGSKAKIFNLFIHLLVWSLLTYLLFVYPPLIGKNVKLPSQFLTKQIFHMLLMVSTYYLNTFYLVPKVLLKGKNVAFMLSVIAIMIFAGLIMARVEIWFSLSDHLRKALGKKMWQNAYVDFFGLFTTIFVLGISTSLALMHQWNREWKLRHEVDSQRAISELAFLKAQINPHFFFNTLNTIYALTYVDSETSREVLLKLSGMMRYLLYDTQHDVTTVSKELTFIKNYIEIMKLRLNDNIIIDFVFPRNVTEATIAPMLLLPFIENAFKHGVNDSEEGIISISIRQDTDSLILDVKNTIDIDYDKCTDIDSKGIGLANTLRRLDLLYRDRYVLNVVKNETLKEYMVHLKISLS